MMKFSLEFVDKESRTITLNAVVLCGKLSLFHFSLYGTKRATS